uniref:Uncharacterized protein n=1 Tax=Romanomermis culicivorax TaxID=13658 RepID=A0A915K800_ROMCU
MSTASVTNLYETLQRLLPNASQIDQSNLAASIGPLTNAAVGIPPLFSMPAKPFIDINKPFDPKLYENWSFIDLIPLLLQTSPCDEKIDGFIETLVSADATNAVRLGADDANRNVRSVLIEHLIQLRDQRKRNQANIEEYVKVLLQVNEDERLAHQNLRAYEDIDLIT